MRFLAMPIRSRPDRGENSTAYTTPSWKTGEDTPTIQTRCTYGSYDIRYVTDRRSTSGTEVQDLLARLDEYMVHTAKDTSSQLRTEGVPHTVLDLGALDTAVDRNTLLAVDRLSRGDVLGDQQALLTLGNENTGMPVRLDDYVGTTPASRTASASATTATASTARTTPSPSTTTTSVAAALCYTAAPTEASAPSKASAVPEASSTVTKASA